MASIEAKKRMLSMFGYVGVLLGAMILWLIVVDSTRHAEKNRRAQSASPTARYGAETSRSEDIGQTNSQTPTVTANPMAARVPPPSSISPYSGQRNDLLNTNNGADFNTAFGSARFGIEDSPAPGRPRGIAPSDSGWIVSNRNVNPAPSPQIYGIGSVPPTYNGSSGAASGLPVRAQFEPMGELARPTYEERSVASSNLTQSAQIPGGYYGQNNKVWPPPGYGQSPQGYRPEQTQSWQTTNSAGASAWGGPRKLAPQVVIVGR
jgi:hypothetical protein